MWMMRRRTTQVLVVGMLLVIAACGGGSDDDGASSDGDGDGDGGTGDVELAIGGDLPDEFPSDFYLPDGLTVGSVSSAGDAISLSGTFESGDVAAIQADMVAGLEAADYELLSDDDMAVFVKNGVGRVRVRTSVFLDELTLSVDIDRWSDEQLDELRALFVEEVIVRGRATAEVDGTTYEAEGECRLTGESRWFLADDGAITIQIDERTDPPQVYADVTTPDGVVFTTEPGVVPSYESSDGELSASGDMVEYTNEAAGTVSFTITATCDM